MNNCGADTICTVLSTSSWPSAFVVVGLAFAIVWLLK